jgi:hypothetical protein
MKAISPYIFPLIVVVIVFFLIFRWYSNQQTTTSDIGEGITIENLSESELSDVLSGVGDYDTIELEPVEPPTSEPTGDEAADAAEAERRQRLRRALLGLAAVVRYEIDGDRLRLSVIGQPEETAADTTADESEEAEATPEYTVWFKRKDGGEIQRGFVLEPGKGGLIGSGSLPASLLPLEVFVTQGSEWNDDLSNVVLKGIIEPKTAE